MAEKTCQAFFELFFVGRGRVVTFLDYFDQIKKSNFFEWEHAREAKPMELATKVLSLIDGKNLFIGICTKKERVISEQELQRGWVKKNTLLGSEAAFAWKTSDWIIQEIGLAIGRRMDLLLLVESGLRPPGGLQGNIEYIEFDRNVPERSFGRILEMLHALRPKSVSTKPVESEPLSSPDNKQDNTRDSNNWLCPKPYWRKHNYEVALMHMVEIGDITGEKTISDAYLLTEDGNSHRNMSEWEALKELCHLKFGKGGKISHLEELAKAIPENDEIHRCLALGYGAFKEYEKSAEEFEMAGQVAIDPRTQVSRFGDAAIAFINANKKDEARRLVASIKEATISLGEVDEAVVAALREVAEREGNKDFYFGLSEIFLAMHPDDSSVRFELAYEYAQQDLERLSLFHYLRIPHSERSTAAWNNLGVQYDHFKLSNKAVESYRVAEEQGETLAMSNLAQKFIGAGFLKEAYEICQRALKEADYDKNIGSAIRRIKEVPEEEERTEKELVEKSANYSEFYRSYGRALTYPDISDVIGNWKGPKCHLCIVIKDGNFIAEGEYEVKYPTLGFLSVLQGYSAATKSQSTKRRVRYEGKISGHTIKGVVNDHDVGALNEVRRSTILGSEDDPEVLMVITESKSEIWVYEKRSKKEDGLLYKITRLVGGAT